MWQSFSLCGNPNRLPNTITAESDCFVIVVCDRGNYFMHSIDDGCQKKLCNKKTTLLYSTLSLKRAQTLGVQHLSLLCIYH